MSRLLDTRARLLAAFAAGGIRTATTGKYSAPVVVVEAGDPWSEPFSHGRARLARWRLTVIAGRSDAEGSLAALGGLVDQVDDAIRTMRSVSLPTWGQPIDLALDAGTYAASVSLVSIPTEETAP